MCRNSRVVIQQSDQCSFHVGIDSIHKVRLDELLQVT